MISLIIPPYCEIFSTSPMCRSIFCLFAVLLYFPCRCLSIIWSLATLSPREHLRQYALESAAFHARSSTFHLAGYIGLRTEDATYWCIMMVFFHLFLHYCRITMLSDTHIFAITCIILYCICLCQSRRDPFFFCFSTLAY
jgi:hypothetical protein